MEKRRQLHVWLTDEERAIIEECAGDRGESVSATLRWLIRQLKRASSPGADGSSDRRRGGATTA